MRVFRILLSCCLLLLVWCASAVAQTDAKKPASEEELTGLQIVDWIIISIYAASTLVLGWYYGRQQKSTKEYFVGSGNMNSFFIGVSLFATLLSTISYLSYPGEAFGKGPGILAVYLAAPISYLVVAYVLLPIYMKQRVTSAYELLEAKLGISVRLLGAVLFIVLRLVWMSLLMYAAANALSVMMGIPEADRGRWIPFIVLISGFVAVTYSCLGGLRAVVVTDFMQTVLLYGGALMVIITVTIAMKGFGWFPTTWHKNWDVQPLYSFNPAVRVTFLGSFISFLVWMISTAGGDQTVIQRFMATTDKSAARRAYAVQLTCSVVVGVTLALVGYSLLGFADSQGVQGDWFEKKADDIFPYYVSHFLPVGVSGLVAAAMFAAAMSSVDSGVNSITAVFMTDFLDRFNFRPESERWHVFISKVLAFVIGGVVVFGSSFVGMVPGNITAVTNKTVNLLPPIIFSLFFFALFVPFSRPIGVWCGFICSFTVAVLAAFSGPIVTYLALNHGVDPTTFGVEIHPETRMAPDPISFQWVGTIGLIVNLSVGTTVSWFVSRVSKAK